MTTSPGTRRHFSRRAFLLSGAAALPIAGCNLIGGGGDDEPASGASNGGASGASGLSGSLTVVLVPDPPGASEFYRAQMDLFTEQTGVTVDIIENPADQQLNALELMFQQGEGPDVFRAQGSPALSRFHERGWLADLSEIATDEFVSRFPEGSMDPSVSGLHRDGTLLSVPLVWGDWGYTHVLLYNTDILEQNGFDGPPSTWSELEEVASTITGNGGGDVYGVAPVELKYIADSAQPFSQMPGVNLVAGRPNLGDPALAEVVDVWRRLQADGVTIPGWESWDGARAFSEFAAGRIAMYPSATWHIAEIRKLAPDIGLGIAPVPVPDSGRVAYSARSAAHQPIWSMSAESANPEAAYALMDFLGSVDFYRAYYETFGSFTAAQSAWEDQAKENPDQAAILDVAAQTIRTVPNPELLAQGAEAFWGAAAGDPNINWQDAVKEAVINDVDFAPLGAALDDKTEALIAEYEADTPDLRDLLTFQDWDPLDDWTPSA